MRVAVLGGSGFLGANLTRRLVADGHDVTVVDRFGPSSWWRGEALAGARRRPADLTDPFHARCAVRDRDWVFHFAADMGGVGYFHSDADLGAAMLNGQITTNVFRAVMAEEVPRTFYASSACAYPVECQQDPNDPPLLAEDWVGAGTPDACYGAETLHGLRLAAMVPGARVGILHTIYGPLQDWAGHRAKFPPAVAAKALDAVHTGRLELWGDGRQMRSYLYVDDAVERIVRVMEADGYWGPVNIGATGAISCRDVALICLGLAGATEAEIVTNTAEPSGVLARDCDNYRFGVRYGAGGIPDRTYPGGFGALIDWLRGVRQ